MKRHEILFAGACLCAFVATPALAKQCPAGQIFRVSKNACMDKAEALKAGVVINHDQKKSARTATATPAADAQVTSVARSEPAASPVQETAVASASQAATSLPPAALGFASTAPQFDVRRNIAPFGALQFDGLQRN